jgi:hypothetical protein
MEIPMVTKALPGFSTRAVLAICLSVMFLSGFGCGKLDTAVPPIASAMPWDPFLDTLQVRTLRYFLDVTPRATGLAPDRWPTPAPSSVAAVGFALTSYPIAAERNMIKRTEAADRVLTTLKFLSNLPQSEHVSGTSGFKGFFYHFIDCRTGERAWKCELSTIDTGLLLAGVLFCQSYFDGGDAVEDSIRALADSLYRRVDWTWFCGTRKGLMTGWYPERGFLEHTWTGYNEAFVLYLLALGSPTHPIPDWYMRTWYDTYKWGSFNGIEHLGFGPLFGHQYSHCWIDFRGIRDRYMWGRGLDYFENSRRATYAQRSYGASNPQSFRDYSDVIWGWTACDGPKDTNFVVEGIARGFYSYRAREVTFDWVEDDGTIAPTAAGGSVAFAPEISVPALKAMRHRYGSRLWREYGFVDAFNPTFRNPPVWPDGWFDRDYLGIDQGPIAIMIENLRSGLVWETMKRNRYIIKGLRRAGFSGGWLNTENGS